QQVVTEAHAAARGPLVTAADLPFRFRTGYDAQLAGPPQTPQAIDLEALLREIEAREIRRALEESRNNKSRAAELLGLTRPRLYRRMEQLGIADPVEAGEPGTTKPIPAAAAPVDPDTSLQAPDQQTPDSQVSETADSQA